MSSQYIYPLKDFEIKQSFGADEAYYRQYGQLGHNGIDLGTTLGADVVAARSGTVKFAGNGRDLAFVGLIAGNYVLIDHGDMWTGYAHNSAIRVKAGDQVKQGQLIALAGMTGDASGVHVHFEFITPANPVTNANGFWGRVNPAQFNIVRQGDGMTAASRDVVNSLAEAYLNDNIKSNPGLEFYVGQDVETVIWTFNNSKQRDTYLKNQLNVVSIADIRGNRLDAIAKVVGAKNGDDYETIMSKITNPTGVQLTELAPGKYQVK